MQPSMTVQDAIDIHTIFSDNYNIVDLDTQHLKHVLNTLDIDVPPAYFLAQAWSRLGQVFPQSSALAITLLILENNAHIISDKGILDVRKTSYSLVPGTKQWVETVIRTATPHFQDTKRQIQ
jgi:hypothetical protein